MTVKEIIITKKDVEKIREFMNGGYEDYIRNSPKNCDKHAMGFNIDHRFQAANSHTVSFDSYRGFFGDSGCYTWLSIDNKELFWEAFDKWLNDNKRAVMNGVADIMAEKIKASIDELIKARDELTKKIEEIGNM